MGCDIHAVVEHKGPKYIAWGSVMNEMRLDRHYGIFGLLAKGVRSEFEESLKAKGIPVDISSRAKEDYCYYITDETNYEQHHLSKEDAQKDLDGGYSIRVDENHISRSDWHNASWVSAEELEKLLTLPFVLKEWRGLEDYWAVLAMMKSYLAQGFETRLVFWFDN